MAGGLRRPRFPSGGGRCRCGWMPELAHQPGDHGRGPAAAPVPERRRPVPVRLGAGAGPPAGGSWPGACGGPGSRAAAADAGAAGCRSSPTSRGGSWPGACGDPVAGSSSVPWCSMSSCRWTEPELAHQLGGSWPGACGGPGEPVPARRWSEWVLRLVFVEKMAANRWRPEKGRCLRRINKELGFTLFKQIWELDLITTFHSDFFRS